MIRFLMFVLYTIILLSILIYYIIKSEHCRIVSFIDMYNTPITRVTITLFNTRLVNKTHLYIRMFAPDYIILHEIAHSICTDVGHTDNFYNTLKLISS